MRLSRGYECREAAFVRDVQRIEAENFASALHRLLYWDQRFFQPDAEVAVANYRYRTLSIQYAKDEQGPP